MPGEAPARKGWDGDGFDWGRYWTPLGGGVWGNGKEGPTPGELIGAFADTVYACSSIIATSMAAIDIRLVVEGRVGELPNRPSKPVRDAGDWRRKSGLRTKGMTLREIGDHPVLDLLYKPNPEASYTDLVTATSLFLEVVGRAFWLVSDKLGLPDRIDLLPAQLVKTVRDDSGKAVRYTVGEGRDAFEYPAEPDPKGMNSRYVIAFRRHHQLDPDGEGVSPLKAVWQQVSLSNAEITSWESIVGQLAQPFLMLTPAPGEMIGEENADRIAKIMTSRFYGPGKGGVFVNQDHLQMQPLSWPPKDMSGLQLQQHLKDRVCNAYHVPRTLLDTQDASYASSKATERHFQLFCLKPRITYLLERITHKLVSRFDEKLFLAPGEFIQKDESVLVQLRQTAVASYQAGISMKNEARAAFDLDPIPGGDQFVAIPDTNTATMGTGSIRPQPEVNRQEATSGSPTKGVESKYDAYPLQPLVDALQRWFAAQHGREGQKATTDEDESLAEELYPVLKAWWDAAAGRLAVKIGLDGSPWEVVQEGIAEAARRAALHLAESTNATTSLEVEEAKRRLREELAAGLEGGETVNQLTARVRQVYERAGTERAYLIADTERTAAINSAELLTAKGAGLTGKTWLADSGACPKCAALNGRSIGIDEPFSVDPGPYGVRMAPPRHPGCRCVAVWS